MYVRPDNGLPSYVLAGDMAKGIVVLDHTRYHLPSVRRTFNGRDIFAPVAALSLGTPLDTPETSTDTWVTFPLSQPHVSEGIVLCHAIAVNVFGNAIIDMTEDLYDMWDVSGYQITVGTYDIPSPATSYSEVPTGTPAALFGSSGHMEIAVRNGNAQAVLGLQRGDTICLRKEE